MKKLIIPVLIVLLMLTACGNPIQNEQESSQAASKFVVLEDAYKWTIVYDKDTNVMYAISNGLYNVGTFTMLVNADGTPKLWEE